MPAVSNGGTTYTFTVRPGLGSSPPSTETVSADSFKRAIERVQAFGSLFAKSLDDVESMNAVGDTLTINIEAPDPGILVRLAMPYFCAVPSDAPMGAASPTPLASAGPYYVFSQSASQVDVRRNPNYGGDRVRNLGRILYQLGSSNPVNITNAQNGTVDYVPQVALSSSLNADYGPETAAAATRPPADAGAAAVAFRRSCSMRPRAGRSRTRTCGRP